MNACRGGRWLGRGWRVVVGAAAMGLLVGCSGGGPERIPLRGTVEVGGQPLADGSISLMPAKGHSGPSATTSIAAGRYEFTRENGPTAGPHRVIVRVTTEDKAMMLSKAAGQAPQSQPKRPGKTRWERQTEVPDREPYEYDVKLD